MIQVLAATEIQWQNQQFDDVKLMKTIGIIRRYGQHKLILCRRTDTGPITLVSGRYILAACISLGKEYLHAYVFENLTDADVATLKIIQNLPKAIDVVGTAKLLEEINDIKSLTNLLPFTFDELRNFKDLKNFNWDDYDNNEQNFQTALFL